MYWKWPPLPLCIIYFIFSSSMMYYFTTASRLIFEQLCHLDNLSSHFILWNNFFEGLFLRSWWRWEWGTKVSSHSLTFQLFSVNVSKVKHNFIKCKKIYHHQQQQCWTKALKLCCWISDDIELILNVIFNRYVYKHADLRPWDPRNDVLQ